jgi:hypothetical protein
MEAQRFPEDFDGYMPSAPVYDYTGVNIIAASWFWPTINANCGKSSGSNSNRHLVFFPAGHFFVTPTQLRGRECVWQGVTGSPRRFYRDQEYQDDFFGSDSRCANYCCDCG